MQVLHDTSVNLKHLDYGILIPLRETAQLIWSGLQGKNHPHLTLVADNFSQQEQYQTTQQDLARVHSAEITNNFWLEKEAHFLQTYQLIKEDGSYHRYDPSIATKPLGEIAIPLKQHISCGYAAMTLALANNKPSFYLGGGMHHAHRDYIHGFCPINDIAVNIKRLQANSLVQNVWVIDTDAHRGDGTASIFAGDDSVKTLSIHTKDGWPQDLPSTLGDGSLPCYRIPSDVDIFMGKGEDEHYLARLQQGIQQLEKMSEPDLVIVVCGSDTYEHDELLSSAEIQLSLAQSDEKNLWLYNYLNHKNVAHTWLMAGGYGDRAYEPFLSFLEKIS